MSFRERLCPVLAAVVLACGVAEAQIVGAEGFGINDTRSYLGIQMEDVTAENMSRYKLKSEKGAIVRSVTPGSPADDANLREDDVILEYAGYPVWSSAQLSRYVQETPPGRSVDLALSRDGMPMNANARIRTRNTGRDYRSEILPRDFLGRAFHFSIPDGDGDMDRRAEKPRLGVELQPLSRQLAEFLGAPAKGVLVASVLDGSPSAGKLKSGDVIVSADGKSVSEPADLTRILRDRGEGTLELKVIRDKKEVAISVTLPSPQGSGGGRGVKL